MQRRKDASEKPLKECAELYPVLADTFIRAEKGDPLALALISQSFEKGLNKIPKNEKRAFQLMKQAAEKGFAPAQNCLAWYYYEGIGIDKNNEEAFKWLIKAAEDIGDALFGLARFYEQGFAFEDAAKNHQDNSNVQKPLTSQSENKVNSQHDDPKSEAMLKQAWDYENKLPLNTKKACEGYVAAKKLQHPAAVARLKLFATMASLPKTFKISYDDCQFGKQLGKGFSSTVYEVTLLSKSKLIAVKRPKHCDEFVLQCFNAEARVVQLNLKSPNIVKYLGVCLNPPMIAMEKLNSSLMDFISKNNFNPKIYYPIAKSIANGVADFHKMDFIHRDIKPHNILLDDKMSPKLIDFGFAMQETENAPRRSGSLAFQAPELFKKSHPDRFKFSKKTDIFALGMTFFTMVAGNTPFSDITIDYFPEKTRAVRLQKEIEYLIKTGENPEIPKHCPSLFAQLIRDCWQLNPDDRPTASHVVERLDGMIRGVANQ